ADPENESYFSENLAVFKEKADEADLEIRETLAPYEGREIVTFHDAWGYFAEEYGLKVVASFEPFPGDEPTPGYLKDLSDAVKEKNIGVIFSEPAFSADSVRAFTSDLGINLFVLYPAEEYSSQATFIETMVYNAKTIAEALSE
ncbi:MAG: metal ABC transporter substrate-binding protein, partial [Candidatus Colwellbacteria bacterium]|nr:metal ABC transporter substrate-binding protein [Candidatus Colwellbacteria bacterium]